MADRSNCQAVVFPEGAAGVIWSELVAGDKELSKLMGTETHVVVPFYRLFREILQEKRFFGFLERARVLNDNELMLIRLFRSGKANKITIHLKAGKPEIIEVERHAKVQVESRLSEILLKEGYQEIRIKTNGGDVSFTSITDKFHLK